MKYILQIIAIISIAINITMIEISVNQENNHLKIIHLPEEFSQITIDDTLVIIPCDNQMKVWFYHPRDIMDRVSNKYLYIVK